MLHRVEYVHVAGPKRGQVRLAWETHYVGDVRAIHSRVLDSYMLKSLDAVMEFDVEVRAPACASLTYLRSRYHTTQEMKVTMDSDGRLWVGFADESASCSGPNPFRSVVCRGVWHRHVPGPVCRGVALSRA